MEKNCLKNCFNCSGVPNYLRSDYGTENCLIAHCFSFKKYCYWFAREIVHIDPFLQKVRKNVHTNVNELSAGKFNYHAHWWELYT